LRQVGGALDDIALPGIGIPGDLDGIAAVEEEVAVDGNNDRRANPNQQTHTQANRE
jgi:hypothetical protein